MHVFPHFQGKKSKKREEPENPQRSQKNDAKKSEKMADKKKKKRKSKRKKSSSSEEEYSLSPSKPAGKKKKRDCEETMSDVFSDSSDVEAKRLGLMLPDPSKVSLTPFLPSSLSLSLIPLTFHRSSESSPPDLVQVQSL